MFRTYSSYVIYQWNFGRTPKVLLKESIVPSNIWKSDNSWIESNTETLQLLIQTPLLDYDLVEIDEEQIYWHDSEDTEKKRCKRGKIIRNGKEAWVIYISDPFMTPGLNRFMRYTNDEERGKGLLYSQFFLNLIEDRWGTDICTGWSI